MNLRRSWISLSVLLLMAGNLVFALPRSQNRDDIQDEYKWNFKDIYADWNAWEQGMADLEKKMEAVASMKGTLAESEENLLKILQLQDETDMLSYRVYRYPQLMLDVDTRNQEISGNFQKVQILFAKYSTATAWISPEILAIPWEKMQGWLNGNAAFAPYRHNISNLYRQQAHVLDEDKEKQLSYFSRFNQTPRSIYSELSTSDIDFPKITLSSGDEIQVTRGNYSRVLATNRNQEDRKNIFEAHYKVFDANKNTYAAIYNSVCQRDWANAQARNYKTTLEAALEDNNIPVEVYLNLVNSVKANVGPFQRYMKLRKKILGLEEYHSYDGSIPLVDFDKTYPYDEAKKWVVESVAPLGKDYQKKLKTAISSGWLDVYENTGKRPGAYSANVYGVHPFMLLNYNETLPYVFTLAHELGHTIHSVLSNETQPFATHGITIFVAEVASTFNERLLLDYLLKQTKDPKERIALLQQAIRGIVGTFYFQTLLADFELQVHQLAEQGKPITTTVLNQIMQDLFAAYYGETLARDEILDVVWARIGHFYRVPYYVYQYATCFASSAQMYKQVTTGPKKQRQQALENYLQLLKSGTNDYPMELLKKAGVDLTKTEAFMAIFEQMDVLVTALEKEFSKLK